MVASNDSAWFMWIQISDMPPLSRDIYIVVYYFSPMSLDFALRRDVDMDPYLDLYEEIIELLIVGEVIFLQDFNAHIGDRHTPFHNKSKEDLFLQEIDPILVDLHRVSDDMPRHLLHLGESHDLLILNELPYFLASCNFTCFTHNSGASVLDYVLAD
jgi:hypothetical protein